MSDNDDIAETSEDMRVLELEFPDHKEYNLEKHEKISDVSEQLQQHCRNQALPIFNHPYTTNIFLRKLM